jgi:hypothetical protein
MLLRILKVDEGASNDIISQTPYKGKYRPHILLVATINFDPVEVQDLGGQPHVKVWRAGGKYKKNADTLGYEPDVRFEPVNLKGMSAYEMQFWGDAGAPIRMNDFRVRVISKEEASPAL